MTLGKNFNLRPNLDQQRSLLPTLTSVGFVGFYNLSFKLLFTAMTRLVRSSIGAELNWRGARWVRTSMGAELDGYESRWVRTLMGADRDGCGPR